MSIELLQLRLFLEVAATGSISSAARQANIVQSALSRRMQLLETTVGTPLFTRHAGGMSLTSAGKKLQDHAEIILARYAEMEEDLNLMKDVPQSDVRLGFTKTLSPLMHGVVVSEMRDLLNGVRMQIMEASGPALQKLLQAREIDIAIMTSWRSDSSFEYYPLWREQLFLVVPPSITGDLSEVAHHVRNLPFIGIPGSEDLQKVALDAMAECKIEIKPWLETDSLGSLRQLVEQGNGMAVLPFFAIEREIAEKRLRAFPVNRTLPRYLVRRASFSLQGRSRRFMSFLPNLLLDQVRDNEWIFKYSDREKLAWSRTLC